MRRYLSCRRLEAIKVFREHAMRHCLTLALVAGLAVVALPGQGKAQQDDLVLRGAWEYHEACAVCHGKNGTGEGTMGDILKVAPPDLTKLAERHGGVFPFEYVFKVIDGRLPVEGHGDSDMPVWGRTFRLEALDESEQGVFGADPNLIVGGRIYALAQYLRAIQGGKTVPLIERLRPRRSWPGDIRVWPNHR
jgi:mono/diheme cytochrome c family protein